MEDDPVKKRVVMPVILLYTFLLLGLTACGDKLPDLSEDQSELVAEYAAGVALENSENYDSGIASAEEIEKEEKRIERIEKSEQAKADFTKKEEKKQVYFASSKALDSRITTILIVPGYCISFSILSTLFSALETRLQ